MMLRQTVPKVLKRSLGLGVALGFAVMTSPGGPIAAQGSIQSATVDFLPGGPGREGYESARVTVRYLFANCSGTLQLQIAPVSGGVSASRTYWADGRSAQPAEAANPPRRPSFNAPVDVVIGDRTVARARLFGPSADAGFGCYSAYKVDIGPLANFVPANATSAQRDQFVASLRVDVTGPADRTLISDASRNAMARAERQKTDSIARAQAAAALAERQRTDSIARARARATTAAAASAPAGTAGGTAGGTANSTTASAEANAAAAERAAAEARANAAAEAARRQAEADAAFQAEMAKNAEQAVVVGANLIGSIVEARRVSVAQRERRERLEAARQQRAYAEQAAAYTVYQAEVKARFEASPARPLCTSADAREAVVLQRTATTRTIRLTGNECRLPDGRSAVLITLIQTQDAPVSLATGYNRPFVGQLHLRDARTNEVLLSNRENGAIFDNLPRGRYTLMVSSRLPGEIGDVSLELRKLWISDALGSVGAAGAPAKTINGYVGNNSTSSGFMDLTYAVQHRPKWPYLVMNALIGYDTEASEGMFDVGLRQYIGPSNARITPWVEATMGYRLIYVLEEPFTTISPSFGAGLSVRITDGTGLAFSATQITGEATNTDNIWTLPPRPIPLGRTLFRIGLMIY